MSRDVQLEFYPTNNNYFRGGTSRRDVMQRIWALSGFNRLKILLSHASRRTNPPVEVLAEKIANLSFILHIYR